jgi:serine/threonine protein phosphatase PrpC
MIAGRQYAALQTRGARSYQEDNFGCVSDRKPEDPAITDLLLVLSDGMGGHQGGAHASRVAVDSFIEGYFAGNGSLADRLESGLHASNDQIGVDARKDTNLRGMGCTLVGAYFSDEGMVFVSVGDSPLWRWREGQLSRLNHDHSMASKFANQVRNDLLSPEDAARHPERNALRAALIGEDIAEVQLQETPLPMQSGDKFILASDGLETLSDHEIAEIVADNRDALEIARELIARVEAKNRPGQDNTSVVVVCPFQKPVLPPIADWSLD